MISAWDISGSFGGPIKRDRLWFFGNVRSYGNENTVEGAFGNLYAGDVTRWDYARNNAVETRSADSRDIWSIRLTGQVTLRNRVSFSHEYQRRCAGSTITTSGEGACRTRGSDWIGIGTLTSSPESFPGYHDLP